EPAAGLPQLHTTTLEAYQQLAVTLAHAPRRLAALRQHLRRQRQPGAPGPLFDTAAGIRQLERLYRRVARGSRPASDTATPLVSILLAVAADHNADAVERTLHSALAQHYPEVDIIVSDASASPAIEARIAPLLARHPQLRYSRASGLTPAASLDHCLALALGEYIAITPIGDTLHPNRLARMLDFYQRYPGVGLVACWRQPQDASGNDVAGAPGLAAETAVGGTSLAALLLAAEAATVDTLCDPGALLLRRATLSAGFGQYHGRRYQALGPVATVLAALAGGDYVYLPEPLGSRRSAASPSASNSALASLERTLEQLELLYQAHAQQLFASAPQRFAPLLAARLAACHSLLTSQHTALAPLPAPLRQRLDGLLQQGHQLLLG
ncbi:MAG: glycosyltransferase, partial [Sphingomonadaceae bacterium]